MVWYVGKSVDVLQRFKVHHLSNSKVAEWIEREHADGFAVRPRLVEECFHSVGAVERETHWIGVFRQLNAGLLNTINNTSESHAAHLKKVCNEQRGRLFEDQKWLSQILNP